jgi:hypothetical protein
MPGGLSAADHKRAWLAALTPAANGFLEKTYAWIEIQLMANR